MSGGFKNEFNRSQECDEASLKICWVLDCADKSLASHNDADNDPAFFCSDQTLECSLQFWIAHFNCWYPPSEWNFTF